MKRKLLVPTLAVCAAALLGGCVTGYQYRQGPGDYYYGQPSVQYDYGYYGGYGGYGGYPYGWGYGGYPYWGYGYPYYGYPHYHHHHGDHDQPDPPDPPLRPDPKGPRPPGGIGERHPPPGTPRPLVAFPPPSMPAPGGSSPIPPREWVPMAPHADRGPSVMPSAPSEERPRLHRHPG